MSALPAVHRLDRAEALFCVRSNRLPPKSYSKPASNWTAFSPFAHIFGAAG